MSNPATTVLKDALALPLGDRAAVAEELLASVDRPDPAIDARWAEEAEARLAEFRAGRMRAIPAEQVFREFDAP